jgi:hypothetical protein
MTSRQLPDFIRVLPPDFIADLIPDLLRNLMQDLMSNLIQDLTPDLISDLGSDGFHGLVLALDQPSPLTLISTLRQT